jgi:hypothetical protein
MYFEETKVRSSLDLFHCSPGGIILGSESEAGSLSGILLLGEPVDGSLVEEVQYTGV